MSTRGRALGALGIVVAAALLVWAGFAFIGAHDTDHAAAVPPASPAPATALTSPSAEGSVPPNLTKDQAAIVAAVRRYHAAFSEAVRTGNISDLRSLSSPACKCRGDLSGLTKSWTDNHGHS